ncbi:hypothetical protein ACQP06_28105 [Nocardia sp. CA-136227]|uniref:hypothetical protein n=1 Tax=Nocardia sp. CA-136227 TaxID=3239979 RepID=UPI003D97BFC6
MNTPEKPSRWALLFDIRSIIAALLGVYGVVLLVAGLAPGLARVGAGAATHSPDRADLAAGSGANLWVGGILVLITLVFAAWVVLRPAGRA